MPGRTATRIVNVPEMEEVREMEERGSEGAGQGE
ncbi:hypothetical protein E2C01_075792 [Portunus trituberculatus]|uniref:Uncharacterized protein n=1 Tax=Portunus trituberculatus TaxID=210409 RepID=A0A5B7IGP8_PORTR|nr:hypothetical protein [Portunus trituberculatus]